MQSWYETIKFLNEMGLLPLLLLLLAIPGGLVLSLMAIKRLLFKNFSVVNAWDSWLADQRARTQVETDIKNKLAEFTDQIKQLVAGSWDSRRYFDDKLERVESEHKIIITHLENLLLLAKKRKTDWIREPETEMFLQPREKETVC